jgi:hypothetical protein
MSSFYEAYAYNEVIITEELYDMCSFYEAYSYNEVIVTSKPYGVIYKISSNKDVKVYIGQTISTLTRRWGGHVCCCRDYALVASGKNRYKNHCKALYRAMIKHGVNSFRIEQIDVAYSEDELNDLEIKYIKQFNSYTPNGYNITKGGASRSIVSDEAKEAARLKCIASIHANIDAKRHCEASKGLPPLVQMCHKGDNIIYQIQNFPGKCKLKCFSSSKYGSVENAKKACLDYYNILKTTDTVYIKQKQRPDLPKGITALRNGYKCSKMHKKKRYAKEFLLGTNEENLVNAKAYLQQLLDSWKEE